MSVAPSLAFLVSWFSMVRLGDFLYRVGWVISGLLLFDVPPTIFAYSGFVARLTNIDETIEIGFACTAMVGGTGHGISSSPDWKD